MNTARHQVAPTSALVLAVSLLAGCSSSGGTFTLFPTGDYLLKSTKFVRRSVPRQLPVPRELEKTLLPDYLLQPGDVLVVEPTALDSPVRFPADQTILADGTIDLGRFGRIIVAGKTIEQVEADVAAAVRGVEPGAAVGVNVRLVNPQSAVYYVLGEVNSPGSFPLIGRETVLDALLAAGGLSDKASPCNIILSRPTEPGGCRTVLPVCYRHIVQLGDTTTNYQIMPGDRVYVATRTFGEALFNKRSCPICQGVQCPCPSSSALLPALPTITPPRILGGATPLPATDESLPESPYVPD
ncbi:MAG: hypothetical protein B7Z73_05770 [Planctomycetia bacterium 21-64-5]|nr:MAG: hypothetical protein B7Z73_05770 [Planctomycetia bacterium 21-64-5]HQU41182.1 polysaccharide biosynthesis/export family protein [Pirellulales bacterium]